MSIVTGGVSSIITRSDLSTVCLDFVQAGKSLLHVNETGSQSSDSFTHRTQNPTTRRGASGYPAPVISIYSASNDISETDLTSLSKCFPDSTRGFFLPPCTCLSSMWVCIMWGSSRAGLMTFRVSYCLLLYHLRRFSVHLAWTFSAVVISEVQYGNLTTIWLYFLFLTITSHLSTIMIYFSVSFLF